jgi:hypothetical protein
MARETSSARSDAQVALDVTQENQMLRAALDALADIENWTGHGLAAMAEGPLIYGHFDPVELAQRALGGVA